MSPRTILVVGANKGIGFAIVQLLATRSPQDHILLGCRDIQNGTDAIADLRNQRGITSRLDVLRIDILSDASIRVAMEEVREKYKKLDVLINNAGVAFAETADQDLRDVYHRVFNMNVASVVKTCEVFLPFMRETSTDPRIVQVSSARASLTRIAGGKMPPAVAISYGASKAALNAATLELARQNPHVTFQLASPGHCRTDFNNNRGTKDPLDGAKVVAELVLEEAGRECGLWEIEGEDTEPVLVPW